MSRSVTFELRRGAGVALHLTRERRIGSWVRARGAPATLAESHDALCRWVRLAFSVGGGGAPARYALRGGWGDPYPEITGYFLPTLLRLAERTGDGSWRALARDAGDWLVRTRLPSGAICRKQWTPTNTTPSVFNTGQVLEGWCALADAAGEERWLDAARRAGDWLVAEQEPDGSWVRNAYNGIPHAYYTRVAWPLAMLWRLTGEERYADAARRHLEWTCERQDDDGWFREAGFTPDEVPTTHTIAYVVEGLIGAAEMLGEQRWLDAAGRAGEGMLASFERHGFLPGRLGAGWHTAARWRCLTGDAQTGLAWARLARHGRGSRFASAARAIAEQLRATQRLSPEWPEISGAILGSSPVWGGYDAYAYPTHAAKFMLDLLHELEG